MNDTFLKKHEYFMKRRKNRYYFKNEEENYTYSLEIVKDENFIYWYIAPKDKQNSWSVIDDAPIWFQKLYGLAYKEMFWGNKLKRLVNNEKLSISQIVNYTKYAFELKGFIYFSNLEENRTLIVILKHTEIYKEMIELLKQERYVIESFEENNEDRMYKIIIRN